MRLIENIRQFENLEEKIGKKWVRRLKIIVLTAAVYAALGCSEYSKPNSYSQAEQSYSTLEPIKNQER